RVAAVQGDAGAGFLRNARVELAGVAAGGNVDRVHDCVGTAGRRVLRPRGHDLQRVLTRGQAVLGVEDRLELLARRVTVDGGDLRAVEIHVGDAVARVARGDPPDRCAVERDGHAVARLV